MSNEVMDSNPFEFDNNSLTFVEERELAQEHQSQPERGRGTKRGRGARGSSAIPSRKRTNTAHGQQGMPKRTSWVWIHFDIIEATDKETKATTKHAICRHCKGTNYRAEGDKGTSNCIRHLRGCLSYGEWKKKNGGNSEFCQKTYCEMFAEAILRHGYPLSVVEHQYTRILHAYLNPSVKSISRTSITRWCMRKHDDMKKDIFKLLHDSNGKVCLTCDVWTACTSRAYLTLTCHFIDNDWCLKSKVLNFRHFPPPHTGYETYQLVYNLIKEWGLEKKVLSMTVDNATSMDNMVSRLMSSLMVHSNLPSNGKHFHVRCSAHILNLIVKSGLSIIDKSVNRVRENVKYIDSSEARLIRFRECVTDGEKPSNLKLWLDVATRWNSTYMMLDRALHFKNALSLFGETERDFQHHIADDDWESVRKICVLLKPFYIITNLFSGRDYPTANQYLEQVCRIQFHLHRACESDDDNIRMMANEMFEKFDKYWSNYSVILSLAAVLDPRHKFAFLEHLYSKVYDSELEVSRKLTEIRREIGELFNFYKGPVEYVQDAPTPRNSNSWRGSDEFESFDQTRVTILGSGAKSELDTYLDLPLFDASSSPQFDILAWWRDNGKHFPVLAKMAKEILAIPITTAASESSFSMGGRIVNDVRASLTDKNIETLVTTSNWLFGYEELREEGVNVDKEEPCDEESHLMTPAEAENTAAPC